ncbi:putative coxsackievirus and adenovirus receptor [Scophthalmus maximus]|uniref:Putative coxsackievirus and adenovirus receptor n=1 Tax=Scophthalmus maximus TaxID=52904 RepID=A0A2U9B9H2_SCOMX|nr:putative coxsackievirus and adenovirus receptor [Scophthalmus maximus]
MFRVPTDRGRREMLFRPTECHVTAPGRAPLCTCREPGRRRSGVRIHRSSRAAAFHSSLPPQVPRRSFSSSRRSRGLAGTAMELWAARFCCVLLGLSAGLVSALEITSTGPTSIEKASGESVKLDCQFTLGPQDSGPLDIEWSMLSSDNQNEDKVVILYSGDRAYEDYYAPMKGRVHFNSADPKNGDASINLTGLKSTDSGTYQCKVKKAPGIRSRKMLLIVMVKPSKPSCYSEGPTQEGKDITLRCKSSEGTNPLQYTWEKISDSKLLPASTVLDPMGGTINVKNASTSASGTYRCTAGNRVGTEECILHLNVTPPPNTAGIIAGAIIAVLLILIIIAIILFCCCRARHRKKYEKEICNEIREDVPPPKSRVSTARSFTVGSQRSSLGSMSPSNLHEYALKPQYDKIPSSEDFERPPSHAPLPPPSGARMAGPNLSRMGGVPVMIPAQNRDGSIV